MAIATLPGVRSTTFQTDRLAVHALEAGPATGTPVVFVHGNCGSATFWEEELLSLPDGFRGIAVDLRGYGLTEALPVDARLGLDDMVADVRAALDHLRIRRHHLVGHGMGGGVVWKYLLRFAADVRSVTQVAPLSPFGYGGSSGLDGQPLNADGAPAGAGAVNPEFVRRLAAGDRTAKDPLSPLSVFRALYVKPGRTVAREDALLDGMLSTIVDDDHYPGDARPSHHWPGAAPGDRGVANAMSRKHFDASAIVGADRKPDVLWVRGDADRIVADEAMWDVATLGKLGLVPDWPGMEACPPQPMVGQTRAVLEAYGAAGGAFEEVVIEDSAHCPFLEQPTAFRAAFHPFLAAR